MMRVLALVPGGIDDQILFFPALDDLQRHYPQAEIDVVAEPRAKGAYRVCKSVNEVLTFDFKNRNSLADWANLLGKIREREYDLAITLEQRWIVAALLWLTGIPSRIGYAGSAAESLLNHAVPLKTDQYAAYRYHDLLQGLGITTPCPELNINVSKKDLEWAEAEQKRLGLLGGSAASNYVLIHNGSSDLAQSQGVNNIYPVGHWQQIIQNLQQRQPDLALVVLQSPEDHAWVTQLRQACPELKVTAPEDVGKLAAIIAAASLMLCTDSAPMHLAVAVQTYTIALFGPTDPQKLLPSDPRFIGLKSPTGQIADISPTQVLTQLWGA